MKHILGPSSRSTLTNVQQDDVQPNAVDLRIGKVFRLSQSTFIIDETRKQHRGSVEVKPDATGYFNLAEGHYEVIMENMITVGEDEAGWVITRSTLNRNGLFLTSGLYDTGYDGVMAGMLHVTSGPARIAKGTRIGQYLSFNAEALHKYDGDYGRTKAHDKKYTVDDVFETDEEITTQSEPVKRGRGRPKGSVKSKE
jgi:deoxycytidine triphosphate deaminase